MVCVVVLYKVQCMMVTDDGVMECMTIVLAPHKLCGFMDGTHFTNSVLVLCCGLASTMVMW